MPPSAKHLIEILSFISFNFSKLSGWFFKALGKLADSKVVILANEIYIIFPFSLVIFADKLINLELLVRCLVRSSLNFSNGLLYSSE